MKRLTASALALGLAACGAGKPADTGVAPVSGELARESRQPGQIFSDRLQRGLYGPELVVIPAGAFALGALKADKKAPERERPAHGVVFAKAFALSRSEITVAQYGEFVRLSGYRTRAEANGHSGVFDLASGRLVRGQGVDWRHDHLGRPAPAGNPVVHVGFEDAQAYALWLSARTGLRYRLPTEAEWEYAFRAGTGTVYPWGDKPKQPLKGNLTGARDAFPNGRGWRNAIRGYGDGFWGLAPIRQYSSEGFGTFDMLGNVSEWVEDCWHDNYRRAPANGEAWVNPGCARRVVRGSAWLSAVEQSRVSFRMPADAGESNARLGFRLVREL